MLCKLNQDIISDSACDMRSGIEEDLFIYNIGDIDTFVFENDNRHSDNNFIDTVVTGEPFYQLEASSAEYSEEIDEDTGKFIQRLSVMTNFSSELENILSNARNTKYFVCFRQDGDEDYLSIGYKTGATLSYTVELTDDSQIYTIIFSMESEYSAMIVDASNFDLSEKYFTPIFNPLYNIHICETVEGDNNGYLIASYVPKTNTANQPLDVNNQLCSYSGLPQAAYKHEDVVSSGGYYILGTYDDTGVFDGQPVRIFEPVACPIGAIGTISVSPNEIFLNSTTTFQSVDITCDNQWQTVELPPIVNLSNQSGSGDASVIVMSTNVGGDVKIKFKNIVSYEQVALDVHINLIKTERNSYVFPNGQRAFVIPVTCEGGLGTYTLTANAPYLTMVIQDDNSIFCSPMHYTETSEQRWTLTLTHNSDPNEVKNISVTILGSDSNPQWQLVRKYCETV